MNEKYLHTKLSIEASNKCNCGGCAKCGMCIEVCKCKSFSLIYKDSRKRK
jgi:hypothetical protein